jgi:hypothetical protein
MFLLIPPIRLVDVRVKDCPALQPDRNELKEPLIWDLPYSVLEGRLKPLSLPVLQNII